MSNRGFGGVLADYPTSILVTSDFKRILCAIKKNYAYVRFESLSKVTKVAAP
jgi:hypothetical protein